MDETDPIGIKVGDYPAERRVRVGPPPPEDPETSEIGRSLPPGGGIFLAALITFPIMAFLLYLWLR